MFFAPAQIKKRSAEWGSQGLAQRLVLSWNDFVAKVSDSDPPWVLVQTHTGPDAVLATYLKVLGGKGDPRLGHILSLGAQP